ncbi:MAG: RDD family protein [Chloroflexota bacterium]
MRPKRGLERRGRTPAIAGTPVASPGFLPPIRKRPPAFQVASGIPGPDGTIMATTRARVAAYVADLILLSTVTFGVWLVVDQALRLGSFSGGAPGVDRGLVRAAQSVVGIVIEAVYFVALWSGGRRTLGMRLARLRVARIADGGPVTLGSAALRWAVMALPAYALGWLPRLLPEVIGSSYLLLVAVVYGWQVVLLVSVRRSATRQGLHDRAARTAVVTSWD